MSRCSSHSRMGLTIQKLFSVHSGTEEMGIYTIGNRSQASHYKRKESFAGGLKLEVSVWRYGDR